MGFKADTSFLRFLTMGAKGVHQTMSQLAGIGFKPIELERYCGSNKIWATKVKRLRLPDVLCVKTGLRVEIRAKSDLKIRMSDAPANPDRTWDAGLRDADLVAFIACFDTADGPTPADEAMFFTVESLRKSVQLSKLGPPKSASEGAERDRTWPATVPSRDGRILEVTPTKMVAEMFATADQPARNQSYTLNGKSAYLRAGDTFKGEASFLSGGPSSMANLSSFLNQTYDPFAALQSDNAVDRYSAVKSFRYRQDDVAKVRPAIEQFIAKEPEPRVKLEAAGSATSYGSSLGQDAISEFIWTDKHSSELRMEAVLILTELGDGKFSRDTLKAIATHPNFAGDELRQAAIWGLGKTGLKAYEDLLPFIRDPEENVVLHAIAGFGPDVSGTVIEKLVRELTNGDERVAPAASEALRHIGTEAVLHALIKAHDEVPGARNWILATLGRMPPDMIRQKLKGSSLMQTLAPMLLVAPGANWLSSEEMDINISFLFKQNI
jgi:hypothetical protein